MSVTHAIVTKPRRPSRRLRTCWAVVMLAALCCAAAMATHATPARALDKGLCEPRLDDPGTARRCARGADPRDRPAPPRALGTPRGRLEPPRTGAGDVCGRRGRAPGQRGGWSQGGPRQGAPDHLLSAAVGHRPLLVEAPAGHLSGGPADVLPHPDERPRRLRSSGTSGWRATFAVASRPSSAGTSPTCGPTSTRSARRPTSTSRRACTCACSKRSTQA